ncbi:MAG: hypothetical protein WC364_14120 [Eubacteriales bacterium]
MGFLIAYVLDDTVSNAVISNGTKASEINPFTNPIIVNLWGTSFQLAMNDIQGFILFGLAGAAVLWGAYKNYVSKFQSLENKLNELEKENARIKGILEAELHFKSSYLMNNNSNERPQDSGIKTPKKKADNAPTDKGTK